MLARDPKLYDECLKNAYKKRYILEKDTKYKIKTETREQEKRVSKSFEILAGDLLAIY